MDPISMMLMGGIQTGGNLLSSLLGFDKTQQSIEQQEAFQERMSSTAFQRASKDMLAAGINPIMAFGHPASAPSGGAAQMQSPEMGTAFVSGVSAAQGLAKSQAEVEQAGATTENLRRQAEKTSSEKLLVDAQTARELQHVDIESLDKARALAARGLYEGQSGKDIAEAGEFGHNIGRGGAAAAPAAAGYLGERKLDRASSSVATKIAPKVQSAIDTILSVVTGSRNTGRRVPSERTTIGSPDAPFVEQ